MGGVALGSGCSHRSGAETEAPAEAPAEAPGQGMDVEGDIPPRTNAGAGAQSDAAADRDRGGEEAALDHLMDGNQPRAPETTPRDPEEFDGAEDSEAVWTEMEREEAAAGSDVENSSRGRGKTDVSGGSDGECRSSSRDAIAGNRNSNSGDGDGNDSQRNPGGDPSRIAARNQWRPTKGDLVEVQRRMTPGVNKPGGIGSVVKVNATTGAVDVRYMVEGYWERGIDPIYISPAKLDLDRKRSTQGRCEHCGSYRVDCREGCDFFTAPPPRPYEPYTDGNEGEGVLAESFARKERCRRQARLQKRERRRQRRRDRRRPRPSLDGGDVGEGAGRQSGSQRRRRHLPEDCDEEGDPVGGSSQEEREVGSGSSSDSDSPSSDIGQQRRGRATRRLVDSSSSSGGGGSSSSSGSDGGMPVKEGRGKWRLDSLSDKSDFGQDDDSDVEFLDVRRGADRRSERSSRSLSDGGGSETSEGEESEEGRARRPSRDRGRIVPRENARGGYDQDEEADDDVGGGAADARFLQPEGEEDELPPDIADPTRGLQNREELQDELSDLLKKLEGNDATELRDDPENETALEKLAAEVRR